MFTYKIYWFLTDILNDCRIIIGRTLRHSLWVGTLPICPIPSPGVENLSQRTALLPWYSVDTKEVYPAVPRVRVLGEDPLCWRRTCELPALIISSNHKATALRNLVGPATRVRDLVPGKARGTLISICYTILAVPEDTAVLWVRECPKQSGTVGSGNGRLQLSPFPTVHQKVFIALLQLVTLISVYEGQAIPTGPQLLHPIVTGPVLVTAVEMWIETSEIIRTDKIILLCREHSHSSCKH